MDFEDQFQKNLKNSQDLEYVNQKVQEEKIFLIASILSEIHKKAIFEDVKIFYYAFEGDYQSLLSNPQVRCKIKNTKDNKEIWIAPHDLSVEMYSVGTFDKFQIKNYRLIPSGTLKENNILSIEAKKYSFYLGLLFKDLKNDLGNLRNIVEPKWISYFEIGQQERVIMGSLSEDDYINTLENLSIYSNAKRIKEHLIERSYIDLNEKLNIDNINNSIKRKI